MDKDEALDKVKETGTTCFEGAAIYAGTLILSIIALMYDKATKGNGGSYDDMDEDGRQDADTKGAAMGY
jgi:hypothetical protein